MNLETFGLLTAGVVALVAGLLLVRPRFRAASGADKALVLGPVFEAGAMAVFGAEHLLAAQDIMGLVPRWLPGPLFWTYFVGAAWIAAAISFIAWRHVRWSAGLLALAFLIIVATIDLPNLPINAGKRLFWTLTFRELAFAGGAMVLAGSMWPHRTLASITLIRLGRGIVATVLVFYGIQHFLFPLFVPGVPLEKLIPVGCPYPPYSPISSESFWYSPGSALYAFNHPHRSRHCRDHASPAHGLLLRPHSRSGVQHRPRRGRNQLRVRHAVIRRDCSAGRLRCRSSVKLRRKPGVSRQDANPQREEENVGGGATVKDVTTGLTVA